MSANQLYTAHAPQYLAASFMSSQKSGRFTSCLLKLNDTRASGALSWMLDTASTPLKWIQLPPRLAADTHPVGDTKGYALWRGRYILSIGVIGRSHALTYPGWEFKAIANDSLLRSAQLNDTCSPPL